MVPPGRNEDETATNIMKAGFCTDWVWHMALVLFVFMLLLLYLYTYHTLPILHCECNDVVK